MGKGVSSAGGGVRDNTAWDRGRKQDGFMAHTDADEIRKQVGNEAWEKRLSDAQKEALDTYINKGYAFEDINGVLRDPSRGADLETWKMIKDLGRALDDSYLKENVVLLRRSDASLVNGADSAAEVRRMYGEVVTDPGFMSASAKVDFRAYGSTRDVEYHIKVRGGQKGVGAYVQSFADESNKGEYEFLFNRGSSFRILGAYETYGKLHVNMEYVGRTGNGNGKRKR